jgi:hypothetical protein
MKKILAIIFLVVSSILLGGYFDEKKGAQITPLSKEMKGLYTRVYIADEDLEMLKYEQIPDDVQLYGVGLGNIPFIYVINAHSHIEEGKTFRLERADETIKVGDYKYQTYQLCEPKNNATLYLMLSVVFMALFLVFMLWGVKLTQKKRS